MPSLLRPQSDDPAAIQAALAQAFDQIEKAEPWREIGAAGQPAFQNGWANLSPVATSAAFRKNVLGQVELKGMMTSPAGAPNGNGTVAFTLPAGYFDTVRAIRLVGVGSSGLAAPVVAEVVVAITGTVTITLSGVAANAVVTNASINGIVFRPPA